MTLKILKIKPWMIKFKIDERIYFIKEADEAYEYYTILFQYIPLGDKGHYKTVQLKTSFLTFYIPNFVKQKRGQTYRDIDPVRFWSALALYGFGEAVGMSSDDVNKYFLENMKIQCKERIAKLEEELKAKRRELAQLEMES